MLILYSPVPPGNTGTAAYLAALLSRLPERIGEISARQSILIAVDTLSTPLIDIPLVFDGWNLTDYRLVNRQAGDVCVYFLASNQYHAYIYEALASHTAGTCVSVLHDVGAGFFLRELARRPGSAYAGLLGAAFRSTHQFGDTLARDYDHIEPTATYFIDGQGVTIERSNLIITHSYYGRSRLIFGHPDAGLAAKIIVCRHPRPLLRSSPAERSVPQTSHDLITIGSYGYFAVMKRLDSLVAAWSTFIRSYDGPLRPRLRIGGNISPEEQSRLLAGCDEAAQQTIAFLGFLDEEQLHQEIGSVDLLVALRFPSYGETSGIAAHAHEFDTPLAISDFAAFREEDAAFRISVDPEEEQDDLVGAFRAAADAKQMGRPIRNTAPVTGPVVKPDLADVLARLGERG